MTLIPTLIAPLLKALVLMGLLPLLLLLILLLVLLLRLLWVRSSTVLCHITHLVTPMESSNTRPMMMIPTLVAFWLPTNIGALTLVAALALVN
ncbi:hypothetical protein HanIR_Chr16g0811791 [Helianthus annuus]|nr:hypothetical protein HanIR_Chr16g0811791 [Helianthus annuus]